MSTLEELAKNQKTESSDDRKRDLMRCGETVSSKEVEFGKQQTVEVNKIGDILKEIKELEEKRKMK